MIYILHKKQKPIIQPQGSQPAQTIKVLPQLFPPFDPEGYGQYLSLVDE